MTAIHETSRFWIKVDRTPTCWLWRGSTSADGYGFVQFSGKLQRAHRVAWILTNGPIPAEMQVLHRCDNPPCVNPDHLWLGTNADNTADRDRKGRQARGQRTGSGRKTHCPRGHPYSGENLIVTRAGRRECRTCTNARSCERKRRAREDPAFRRADAERRSRARQAEAPKVKPEAAT